MKLKTAWKAVSVANTATGQADIELSEHFKATHQTHLPQAEILQECLDLLKERGLIEEAYLRGSLGRGHGDVHSDIDLFSVILPENIEKAYETVRGYLAQKGGIVTSCYDRLVDDYGGIGFMFIANNEKSGQLYQFDFYMAIKGVAPSMQFTIVPRIYTNNPSYKWMEEYGNPRDLEALPDTAKAFIKKHTTGHGTADRMELLMQEQLLNVFVANKHIKRGQTSRVVLDNHSVVATAIEMLQTLTGYGSNGYSPVALGNEITQFCRENGDNEMKKAADQLDRLFVQKMDQKKLLDIIAFCKTVLKGTFPDRYENQKGAIETFERTVIHDTKKPAPRAQHRPQA